MLQKAAGIFILLPEPLFLCEAPRTSLIMQELARRGNIHTAKTILFIF
jgi:hypothetical protein